MKIGVLFWEPDSTLSEIHVSLIQAEGHQVETFMFNAPIPSDLDAIFVHGPFDSLVPLANQLHAMPKAERPLVSLWMSEQFWNPNIPSFIGRPLSKFRSWGEQHAFQQKNEVWTVKNNWHAAINWGSRFRYFGDILWLQATGVLSILAVPSEWTHQFLANNGIESMIAYNGYTTQWGEQLNLHRDIDVLWLGTAGSKRRQQLIQQIREELKAYNLKLMVVDGKEHPPVHGAERTQLLNRTKVVLNLLRQPWDSNYLRYLLAMSNGAMVVSEPTYRHAPFEPDIHLAQVPVNELAITIAHFCTHEAERQQMADQAHAFITSDLKLQNSIAHILSQLESLQVKEVVYAA